VIDKDDIKDVIDERAPDSGWLAYEVMLNVGRSQLMIGLSVVCDSPLTPRGVYARARTIAAETGARIAIVECRCVDEALLQKRIAARRSLGLPTHHITTWEDFEAARQSILSEMAYPLDDPLLVVDTTRPGPELAADVCAWLTKLEDPLSMSHQGEWNTQRRLHDIVPAH
jgi:hypothetical protein